MYKRILKNSSTRKYTTKNSLQIIKRSLPMSVRKNLKKTSYIRSKYLRRGEKEVKYPRDSLLSTLLVSFVYLHLKNTIFTVSRDYKFHFTYIFLSSRVKIYDNNIIPIVGKRKRAREERASARERIKRKDAWMRGKREREREKKRLILERLEREMRSVRKEISNFSAFRA